MANDNETVEQVCDWLTERNILFAVSISEVKIANPHYDAEACMICALRKLADRIEKAHKRELAAKDREIAELRECLKEACRLQLRCDSCKIRKCESICMLKLKWREALKGATDEIK